MSLPFDHPDRVARREKKRLQREVEAVAFERASKNGKPPSLSAYTRELKRMQKTAKRAYAKSETMAIPRKRK